MDVPQAEKHFFHCFQTRILRETSSDVVSPEQYFNKVNSNVLPVSAFIYAMLCLVRLIVSASAPYCKVPPTAVSRCFPSSR